MWRIDTGMAKTFGGRKEALEITTTNTGFRDGLFASGSVQGWNKFCVQGGIVDVSFTLPGERGVPGVWPAIWMMGNLGRATFTLSTDGLWPWTYSACQPEIERTAGQLISACESDQLVELAGLRPGQGLGLGSAASRQMDARLWVSRHKVSRISRNPMRRRDASPFQPSPG